MKYRTIGDMNSFGWQKQHPGLLIDARTLATDERPKQNEVNQ